MKFQRKKVAAALAMMSAGTAATLLTAVPSYAQDIRVDVTGSNIKRLEGEGSVPVQIITREEIERTGVTSVQDLLQYITAATSSGNFNAGTVIGATTFGLQTASLRGLGGSRTLLLLNGQRMGGFSGDQLNGQSVNLTNVPFSALERVEVLKDGASAIYGTDAIAGVINFITRKDYRGAEATVYYGAPTRSSGGGGDITDVSATVGWGELAKDRYNVMLTGSWHKEDALYGNKRNFANSSIIPDIGLFGFSGNTFPATVTAPPGFPSIGTQNPTFPNCAPSVGGPPELFGEGNTRCVYDPALVAQIYPEIETTQFYGAGRFQINANWQAFLTGTYGKSENHNIIQPVPLSDLFNDPIILQSSSPYYPTAWLQQNFPDYVGNPLNVRYRAVSSGNRDVTDTNEAWQITTGVTGTWRNWDVDVTGFYNETEAKQNINGGFPQLSRVLPILNSGRVNFFGDTPADVLAEVQGANFTGNAFTGTTKMYGGQARMSGEIWKLPAGSVALAAGAEARREEIVNTPNPALQTGDISGFGGSFEAINESRDVWALFAEVNIPIVRNLELNAAVRFDDYSDFGNTTNPKVSLRWNPVKELLVRGSYGTGFLAPSLQQLFLFEREGVTAAGLTDPLRCPTTGSTQDCQTQFNTRFGGNAALQPEESFSVTAGVVWEPIPEVSLGVDFFKINVSDQIQAGLDVGEILGDLSTYGYLVTRGPVQPDFPGLPGPITEIDQRNLNIGSVKIEGIDIDLRFRPPPTAIGRFSVGVTGTYYLKYDEQNPDGSYDNVISNVFGETGGAGVIPRWKSYVTLNWQYGPWGATLGNLYQSSYTDWQTLDSDFNDDGPKRKVSSMSLWDLQGVYTGFKNLTLTLGVKNLFDTDPPVSNQQYTFQSGYDPSYYDSRARFVYGSISYAFK